MDLLDRLLAHDAWTTRKLLELSRDLSDEQLDRSFPMASGSLRKLFVHVIGNVEAWAGLMAGQPIRRSSGGQSIDDLMKRQERAASDLTSLARTIADKNAWDETWTDPGETPSKPRTFGATIAHVITHSMYHRCQLLAMLRELGLQDLPEGDILSWEAQAR